jgi:hypothetical protein
MNVFYLSFTFHALFSKPRAVRTTGIIQAASESRLNEFSPLIPFITGGKKAIGRALCMRKQ